MLAILAAMMGASALGCVPVPGADRLWAPTTRWVLVGEAHGTNEMPMAFANLACLAAASGRPVTVAVEYPAPWQPTLDAYLASDGGPAARTALLALPLWTSKRQFGLSSAAFLNLWDRLRQMKQAGRIQGVVATDAPRPTPPNVDRDAVMAAAWTAIPTPDNGLVLVLVGNVHAMRKPFVYGQGESQITAGSLLPADRTMTVFVTGTQGTAWNCQEDGCGPHPTHGSQQAVSGITYTKNPDEPWEATYELGLPLTASPPAVPVSAATPPTPLADTP